MKPGGQVMKPEVCNHDPRRFRCTSSGDCSCYDQQGKLLPESVRLPVTAPARVPVSVVVSDRLDQQLG